MKLTTDRKTSRAEILAPGKLLLLGEYAVLEGAPALILAIDRWVRVRSEKSEGTSSEPLIASACRYATAHFENVMPCGEWKADSEKLYHDGEKLGLGSSAAVTVATVAAVFAAHGKDIESEEIRHEIWDVAYDAHLAFQGSGSGADLAASTFGGCTHMQPKIENQRPSFETFHLPEDAAFSFVWTGRSASTGWFLEKIAQTALEKPKEYKTILADMQSLLTVFLETRPNAEGLIETLRDYDLTMRGLGTLSNTPIVSEAHDALSRLACRFDGGAKPSGAGGGDFSIAAFKSDAAKDAFERKARLLGYRPFAFHIAERGVHLEDTENV